MVLRQESEVSFNEMKNTLHSAPEAFNSLITNRK